MSKIEPHLSDYLHQLRAIEVPGWSIQAFEYRYDSDEMVTRWRHADYGEAQFLETAVHYKGPELYAKWIAGGLKTTTADGTKVFGG